MQTEEKQIKNLDILSLPPRSERVRVTGEGELPSRSELQEEKKLEEKKIKSRYRLAKILLGLFIPIPLIFILYTINPGLFGIFLGETTSTSAAFDTVHLASAQNDTADKYVFHTVEEGETLSSISIKYFGNSDGEEIIREVNNLSSEELETGQEIKIPKEYIE